MKKLRQVWVTPETHKKARKIAAEDGCSIAEAIAKALGKNAKESEEKVNSYGLFK